MHFCKHPAAEVPAAPRELRNGEVLSVNFSVMLQRDIQAGDVLGFGVRAKQDGRIQHCPFSTNLGPLLAASHPSSLPTSLLPVMPHKVSVEISDSL